MSPKSKIALSFCWVLLCLLRIGGRWDQLSWFFFFSDKEDFRGLPPIDPQRVWHASDAIWWFFGLIFWMILFGRAMISLIRSKACKRNGKDGEDAIPF